LLDGGLFTFRGDLNWLENFMHVSEEITEVQKKVFSGVFIGKQDKYFKSVSNPLLQDIQSEATLGLLQARPCGPHYNVFGIAYRPYIKSQGHRAVCTRLFFTDVELDSFIGFVSTKAGKGTA